MMVWPAVFLFFTLSDSVVGVVLHFAVYLSGSLASDWKFRGKYIRANALYNYQFFGSICIIIDGYVFTFCNS